MFGSNYSLADIAAATNKNESDGLFGGNNGWWIILLFLFTGFGWGGNRAGGSTTREEIAYGFDMNGLSNSVRGVQQGLSDGFYAMNTSILNGFSGLTNTATANTYEIVNGIHDLSSQYATCCCENRSLMERGFADLGYALATQACATRQAITDSSRDIIANTNAGIKSILDFLTQDKIATLTAENQNLKFAASQSAQNAYLISELAPKTPVPAYVVANPYAATYPACNYVG